MDILETAEHYYATSPLPHIQDKRRKLHTQKLLFVIETAPFLSFEEKEQMSRLIPLYPTNVIKNIIGNLIHQGMIYIKIDPAHQDSIQKWIDQAKTEN